MSQSKSSKACPALPTVQTKPASFEMSADLVLEGQMEASPSIVDPSWRAFPPARGSSDPGAGGGLPPIALEGQQLTPSSVTAPSSAGMMIDESGGGGNSASIASTDSWPFVNSKAKYQSKADLSELHQRLDDAFVGICSNSGDSTKQSIKKLQQIMTDAWSLCSTDSECVLPICEYIQKSGCFDNLVHIFVEGKYGARLESGQVIDAYLNVGNITYLLQQGYVDAIVRTIIMHVDKVDEVHIRLGLSMFESLSRFSTDLIRSIFQMGGLDYLLDVCRITTLNNDCLLHTAVSLTNFAMLGDNECHQQMIAKKAHLWLFMLAAHEDERVAFYGCMAISTLASNRCNERIIQEAGSLEVVSAFLRNKKPEDLIRTDAKYRSGRTELWLVGLSQLLRSNVPEVQTIALFQLVMEACLRKGGDKSKVFGQMDIIATVRDLSICPPTVLAGQLADKILLIVGEPVTIRLSRSVPLWTVKDVQYWVEKIGFGSYAENFARQKVDGDLLLRTNEHHLEHEIKIVSAFERMRFLRELSNLKKSADYSCVDPTRLDMWLAKVDPEMSIYAYQMLCKGLDRSSLLFLDENVLSDICLIDNPIHRMKLLSTIKATQKHNLESKHVGDLNVAVLKKKMDVFISYRRSNGSQLASLLKVHLQLKGCK
uniref:ADP-ribosyl cyclase/cyclic ADP-ribose hydrolase n=1 Tax=Romanomermis culicivorax TaxID=13658 RepID=A0A915IQ58_ROMCU